MKTLSSSTKHGILAVIGATIVHFTYGYFYTISNMATYVMGYIIGRVDEDVNRKLVVWLSALPLCVEGFSMPLGGFLARRIGYRIVVGISCVFVSGGILLTNFTVQQSFVGVVMTYSMIMGFGFGLGYSVSLAAATSWFPSRTGLVTGIVVSGFGLGPLVFTPIQMELINPDNVQVNNRTRQMTDNTVLDRVPNAFVLLGALLFALQFIGMFLLRSKSYKRSPPVKSVKNTDEEPKAPCEEDVTSNIHKDEMMVENVPPKQMLCRLDFYLLWLVMFCNIIPVTIITSVSKYFGQEYITNDRFLSVVTSVSALFNAGGRILWGAIVDKTSFKIPLCVMLFVWAAILLSFPHLTLVDGIVLKCLYTIWVCLMFFSLSGVFVIMPAALELLFGPANMAVNFGLLYTAVSCGSFLSGAITMLVSAKDAYFFQFTGCGCVCLIAMFIAFWIEDRNMSKRLNICHWCSSRCKNLRGTQLKNKK